MIENLKFIYFYFSTIEVDIVKENLWGSILGSRFHVVFGFATPHHNPCNRVSYLSERILAFCTHDTDKHTLKQVLIGWIENFINVLLLPPSTQKKETNSLRWDRDEKNNNYYSNNNKAKVFEVLREDPFGSS